MLQLQQTVDKQKEMKDNLYLKNLNLNIIHLA